MALTLEQAKAALANYGMTVDDTILQAYVDIVNDIEQCLIDQGLSNAQIQVVLTNLMLLLVWSAGVFTIESVRGATGASTKFIYDDQIYNKLKNQIGLFDTEGCSAGLIPPNPNTEIFDVVDGL